MIEFKNSNGEAFKKKALKAVVDAVTKRVQAVRCPVHGQPAKVVAKTRGAEISWEVSGCCEHLVSKVKAVLK